MTSASGPASTGIRRSPGKAVGALLIALAAVAPMTIDMFLPSLPAMTAEFETSESVMQLGVTLFLVTFAGSQLVYGPLSDRIGRRPVMFFGLSLFILGSLVALFAPSAEVLIGGRILQGLGGGVGPTLANAMVLDLFGREGAAKFIGYMAIALPLAPALSPVVGGFLEEAWGWRSVFVTLTAIGVVLLVAYSSMLGETRPPDMAARRGLLADYRTLFGNSTYVGYAIVMGAMFGAHLMFISMSSFVLQDELGLSPRIYGLSFGFVAMGIMGGATTAQRLVKRGVTPRQVVVYGAMTSCVGGGMMVLLALAGLEHAMSVLLPQFVVSIGMGLSRPGATAGALVPFPHIAGLASAVLGFSQMAVSSGYNITYSQFVSPSVTGLGVGVFATVATALIVILVLRPGVTEERAARAVA